MKNHNRKNEKTYVMAIDTLNTTTTTNQKSPPAEIIPFKHPRTSRRTPFMLYDNQFFEVQFLSRPTTGDELKDGPSSWFVGDTVVSDGRLGLVTPIDPLFLAIPFLKFNVGRFAPLDQLFPMATQEAPNTHLLAQQKGMDAQLSHVCDVKRGEYFKYSAAKTLIWLEKKNFKRSSNACSRSVDEQFN